MIRKNRPVNVARIQRKIPYLKFVWRDDWGAQPPLERQIIKIPVKNILLTYTETPPCHDDESCKKAVQDIQREQMAQGDVDIHWNFLVGGNGKVYEGRGWDVNAKKAPQFAEYEGTSFDIAYIASDRKHRTEEMKFIKGQLIRGALMEWVLKDPFNFIEDKVDKVQILKEREEQERIEKEKERLEKEKKKKKRAKKRAKRKAAKKKSEDSE